MSAEPSRIILSIDRSKPRFECHAASQIITTLVKAIEILTFFVDFWSSQIQNCAVQIKKMKDEIFSFQLKKKILLRTLTDDLTIICKSYHKGNDRSKFLEK